MEIINLKKRLVFGIVLMLITGIFSIVQINVSAQSPPVADAGGPYGVNECEGILFDASQSIDPDGDSLWYRWNIDGTWSEYSQDPYFEYVWLDDYSGTVIVEVTDEELIDTDSASVFVKNVPPSITNISGPSDLIEVGEEVLFIVDFIDEDDRSSLLSLDTFNVSFEWCDNTSFNIYDLDVGLRNVAASHIYTEAGEYEIIINISDDDGGWVVATWDVAVSEVYAGPDQTIEEGGTLLSSGFFIDPVFDTHVATVNYGDNSDIQSLDLIDNTFNLNHSYSDDGIYIINVKVMSDFYEVGSDNISVTVLNVAPVITSIVGPKNPVQNGTYVSLLSNFTDPGLLDVHSAIFDWGDNTTTDYELDIGNRNVTGFHQYNKTGVFTVMLTVFDDDGGNDSKEFRYAVIYDSDGGFVTGGGWINSPEGAYTPDPNPTGKANFGFVSKYKKGQQNPTGNTEFQFQVADLNFHSDEYDWLVIAGSKAMYKGTGTINNEGEYKFMISAIDGQINGGDSEDKFRIKIWEEDENGDETLVYDNQIEDPDDEDPTTIIGGGQIKIHKA